MSWVYLDDAFYDHPKILAAGPAAVGLWAITLGWTNRNLTAGVIPKAVAGRLVPSGAKLARVLVNVGLWEVNGDNFVVHDYERWNRTATKREQAQAAARRRWDKPKPPPPDADAYAGASADEYTDAVRTDMRTHMREQCPRAPDRAGKDFPHTPKTPEPQKLLEPGLNSSHHPPVVTRPAGKSEEDENPEGFETKLNQAASLLAERRLAATPSAVHNRPAWLRTTELGIRTELRDRHDNSPGLSIDQLVSALETGTRPDPLDTTQAAQNGIHARNDRPRCETCDGTGWIGDPVIRCPDCT